MFRHVLYASLEFMVSILLVLTTTCNNDATTSDKAANNIRQPIMREVNLIEAILTSETESGESVPDTTNKQIPNQGQSVSPIKQMIYVNPTYDFSISYPNGFVIQSQDVSKLSQLTPTPVASIFFMNPTMAAGDMAGIEPPDLEVRVYQTEAVDSLKSWLVSVGFATIDNRDVIQHYHNANVNGLRVCQSTLIAPGCSVYVLGSGRVYQLSPISLEGEAMIKTFVLLP